MTFPALTRQVSEIACSADPSDLPEESLRMARHAILDWFGVALAGFDEPLARILRSTCASDGPSTIIGSSLTASTRDAALINGATSHALDYDDVNVVGHPTAPIFPAALAVGEAVGASPSDILFAYVVGFEVASLVASQAMPSHYTRGFHSTGTLGSIGAAAAVSKLLELDCSETARAIGLAATQAAGLKGMFGTMAKPLHAGKAASNGVLAAELAAAGFEAREDCLEMEQGFFATQSDAAPGLIEDYCFGDQIRHNLFKYHAACYMTHSTIEAIQQILRDQKLVPEDVQSVMITVPKVHLSVCNIPEPSKGLETKFSLRHCAALVLAGEDTSAIETFSDSAARDPDLVALRRKVSVDGRLPLGTNAEVEIITTDGQSHSACHDVGIPAQSLADQEAKLIRKFESLCKHRLGSRWRNACDRLLAFDQLTSAQEAVSAVSVSSPSEPRR